MPAQDNPSTGEITDQLAPVQPPSDNLADDISSSTDSKIPPKNSQPGTRVKVQTYNPSVSSIPSTPKKSKRNHPPGKDDNTQRMLHVSRSGYGGPLTYSPSKGQITHRTVISSSSSIAPLIASADPIELKLHLDETKRTLRNLRAAESKARWELEKQEKAHIATMKKEYETSLIEYRKKDTEEMKRYVRAKEKARRAKELAENREFQEFKRLAKKMHNEYLKRVWSENLDYSMQFAKWQEGLREKFMEEKREEAAYKKENFDMERVVKQWTKNMELILASEEREWSRQVEAEFALRCAAKEQRELESRLSLLQVAKSRPLKKDVPLF